MKAKALLVSVLSMVMGQAGTLMASSEELKTMEMDGMRVTWLQDMAASHSRSIFPDASDALMDSLGLRDGVPSSMSAFLVEKDGKQILFDSGVGGEKSRLALLKLLLRPVNLLILDEPTNHLDLHSKDVLLDALKDFGGTVIFVSHDRGFIEDLATKVLELTPPEQPQGNGTYRIFPGSYTYYLERLEAEKNGQIPPAGGGKPEAAGTKQPTTEEKAAGTKIPAASGTAKYEEQKRLKNERRRLEREEDRLMEAIAAAETEKAALEAKLSEPAVYSDPVQSRKVQQEIEAVENRIEQLNTEWEAVSLQLG